MKKSLLLVVFAVVIAATTQAQTKTTLFFLDTIHIVNGTVYTNAYDDIEKYHESDWLIMKSVPDFGQWIYVYLNDTGEKPVVYVYFMIDELCYKLVTYTGKDWQKHAKEIVKDEYLIPNYQFD